MSTRSWVTQVSCNKEDLSRFHDRIFGSEYDCDISHCIVVDEEGIEYFNADTVLVCWSGDGKKSIESLQDKDLIANTVLLENIDDSKVYRLSKLRHYESKITSTVDLMDKKSFLEHIETIRGF